MKGKRIVSVLMAAVLMAAASAAQTVQASTVTESGAAGLTAGGSVGSNMTVRTQSKMKTVKMAVTEKYKIKTNAKNPKIETSNKKVVSVRYKKSSDGKYVYIIRAKKKGRATVTYKVKGKTVKLKVTVKNPKLSAKSKTICYTGIGYLTVNTACGKVEWTTSDDIRLDLEQISNTKVKLTGEYPGDYTVTAKVGKRTLTCKVTVSETVRLLSNKKIAVFYTGCDSDGVHFEIKNKTNKKLSAAFSTIALDSINYDIIGSDYYSWTAVPAKSTVAVVQALPKSYRYGGCEMSGNVRYKLNGSTSELVGSFTDVTITPLVESVAESGYVRLYGDDQLVVHYYWYSSSTDGPTLRIYNRTGSEMTCSFESFSLDDTVYELTGTEYYKTVHITQGSSEYMVLPLPDGFSRDDVLALSGTITYSAGSIKQTITFTDVSIEDCEL